MMNVPCAFDPISRLYAGKIGLVVPLMLSMILVGSVVMRLILTGAGAAGGGER